MQAKVIGILLKYVLPLIVLAALLMAARGYWMEKGKELRQPEVDAAVQAKIAMNADMALLKGKVSAYETMGNKVDQVRDELTAQAAGQQEALMARLKGLGLIMAKPRTGDECKDARQVAVEYFNQLKTGVAK